MRVPNLVCSSFVDTYWYHAEIFLFIVPLCYQQNKKERKKVREVGILKKDPEAIKDQIQKLEMMSK